MINFACGSRRFVILTKNYAIKIPIFWDWVSFISGVRENLEERYWWCSESGVNKDGEWTHQRLARIHWASRFGLCNVMERCDTEVHSDRHSEFSMQKGIDELRAYYRNFTFATDIAKNNVGWTKDGRLVLIDYGYFGGTANCYLGFPNGFSLMKFMRMTAYRIQHRVRDIKEALYPSMKSYDRNVSIAYKVRDPRKRAPTVAVELAPITRNPLECGDLIRDPIDYAIDNIFTPLHPSDEDLGPNDYRYRLLRVHATDEWDVAVTVNRRPIPDPPNPPFPYSAGLGTHALYYVIERSRGKKSNPSWERARYLTAEFHRNVAQARDLSFTVRR